MVLWRHGRTAYNASARFQGQLDVPLDEEGVAQAHRAAAVLAQLPPARLVTSDLTRAAWTLAVLAELTALPTHVDEDFREVHAGSWQGHGHAEIAARWPREYAAWRGGEDVRIGGGEKRSEVGVRVVDAITRHAEATPDDGTLVVSTHGGAARAGILTLLDLGIANWPRLGALGNARWAVLARRGRDWALTGYDLGPTGPAAPGGLPAPIASAAVGLARAASAPTGPAPTGPAPVSGTPAGDRGAGHPEDDATL